MRVGAPTDLPWTWGVRAPVGRRPPAAAPDARPARRAVHSGADPDLLWLWLCQLRRAPYSYDLLDNVGRRSPRRPDPSLMSLRAGQRVMTIFDLTEFEPGRSLRLRMRPGLPTLLFGALWVDYRLSPAPGPRSTTLLSAVLWMPHPPGPLGAVRRYLLAWGDVLMMRKQLRTLSRLAERG